jgi:hypothetical protein
MQRPNVVLVAEGYDVREACAVDFKRDPNNPVWESYCPNSGTLNTLTEAWWPTNIV